MTDVATAETISGDVLPRWSVSDLFESTDSREFTDGLERASADADRLHAVFDDHDVRAIEPRPATPADGAVADEIIRAYNETLEHLALMRAYVYATVSTDSRDERAQSLLSELSVIDSRIVPLLARFADWINALNVGSGGPEALAAVSEEAASHAGPLLRLAERSAHQMAESEEGLHAELSTTGSTAWGRLQADVTSQLSTAVRLPDGTTSTMPMPAVRGLATHADPALRRAAYDA